uniref:Uncharacterized protein n=1 Tax=Medicago truncatula TaxID=3880 RepID=A2Q1B4_MEDTR|nr:hypothetical protein MtrDRAFT_AC148396g18v2 [Medicago truncatula]
MVGDGYHSCGIYRAIVFEYSYCSTFENKFIQKPLSLTLEGLFGKPKKKLLAFSL